MLTSILFLLFTLAIVAQLIYVAWFFRRIAALPYYALPEAGERQFVSIIICARNEAGNLSSNLPVVLAQRYTNQSGNPLFEVVVVDDGSTDDTAQVLARLQFQYPYLHVVTIPADEVRDLKGKKYALARGVEQAKANWLVMIDADCVPAGNMWLLHMAAPLAAGKEIVAGYGGYYSSPGLLNAFIRWETLHTFLQYSTYALAGKPYMAVGRNMACTRYIVLKAQRSEVWNMVPSGDDDLLVSVGAQDHNTAIVAAPAAFTCSQPKRSWREWVHQKQRHLSAGKLYKDNIKTLLGFYGASHTDAWICFFVLLFTSRWPAAVFLMATRSAVYWSIWAFTATKLKEKSLIFLFPVFDVGWMLYNFAFFPYIIWKNKEEWK